MEKRGIYDAKTERSIRIECPRFETSAPLPPAAPGPSLDAGSQVRSLRGLCWYHALVPAVTGLSSGLTLVPLFTQTGQTEDGPHGGCCRTSCVQAPIWNSQNHFSPIYSDTREVTCRLFLVPLPRQKVPSTSLFSQTQSSTQNFWNSDHRTPSNEEPPAH